MVTRITLMLLIGLPGAGKSTLCKKIFQDMKKKTNYSETYLIHVCFDALIPLELQEKFVLIKQGKLEDAGDGTNWKSLRKDICSKVGRLIECLKNKSIDSDLFASLGITEELDKNVKYGILLDDNFYYRSMRYEYFQIARKHSVGFCQCYIECPIEIAVRQNASREAKVPIDAIEVMSRNLQPPQPEEHTWEENTLVLSPQCSNKLDLVWDIISKSLESPVPPLQIRDDEIAEARLKCSLSVAHQADLMMRSLVGALIKEAKAKANFPSAKLPDFSRKVNAGRQNVLASIKDGSLKFPAHLAIEYCDENKQDMYDFLKSELEKNL